MNFELTEEQNLIRETVRDFAVNEIAPSAKERDEGTSEIQRVVIGTAIARG